MSVPDPVLVIVEAPPDKAGRLRLAIARATDGTVFVPAFTTEDAVLRFQAAGAPVASAQIRDIKGFLDLADIGFLVINPGDEHPVVLPRASLAAD